MWKFWKRMFKDEITITEIQMNTLARWYFYDAGLADPNKLSSLVGMIPVSSEGSKKEEEASDARLIRVIPLIPFLQTVSDINAKTMATLQFDHYVSTGQVDPEQLTDEKDSIEDMYNQVGYSALLSAFASALELGIISTDTINGEAIEDEQQ